MFKGSQPSKKDSKEENSNSDECKKLMLQDIVAEIYNICDDGKELVKKKNAESLLKFQATSDSNFNKFSQISKDLLKNLTEFANFLNDSKCELSLKSFADQLQQQMSPLFLNLNKQITQKSITIQANSYVESKAKAISKFLADTIADIKAFNQAGCCGGGELKKKLQREIPRNFYVSIHFLESISQMIGLPSKQEFKSTEWDMEGAKNRISQSVDKYFPTGSNVVFVEKEKEVVKIVDRPIEVVKYIDKIVEKQIEGPQDDTIQKGHENFYGLSQPQQVKKGLEFYLSGEKNNNCKALNCLGQIYLEGKTVEKDLKRSYQYYLRSSEMNDPEGLYRIGLFYERGDINQVTSQKLNQEQLLKKAVEFYKKSANQKHYDALTDLGYIYENGLKTDNGTVIEQQDFTKAKQNYDAVDIENCPRACNNLGTLSLKQNKEKQAVNYFQKADILGNPSGSMNLGICYLKGIGVTKDLNRALELLKKAAKKGNQEAKLQYCYYLLQQASVQDNEQEYFQIATYLREILAINPNCSDAQLYLGFLYELGLGVEPDSNASLKYYFQSAELKNDKAQTKLGDLYFAGGLLPKDIKKAKLFYGKAVEQGNIIAMCNLGAIYEEGYDGEGPQYEKAYEFYLKAANGGSAEAWAHIGMMIEKGRKSESKIGEGYSALIQAYQMGSVNSLCFLKDKLQALEEDEVELNFQDTNLEKHRILKDNSEKINSKFKKLSEEQNPNIMKSVRVLQNYIESDQGMQLLQWENVLLKS